MSVNIVMTNAQGREVGYHLASHGGLKSLSKWAESLPDDGFQAVQELFRDGLTMDSSVFAGQLARAIQDHRPARRDVADMLARLKEEVGSGEPGESILFEL